MADVSDQLRRVVVIGISEEGGHWALELLNAGCAVIVAVPKSSLSHLQKHFRRLEPLLDHPERWQNFQTLAIEEMVSHWSEAQCVFDFRLPQGKDPLKEKVMPKLAQSVDWISCGPYHGDQEHLALSWVGSISEHRHLEVSQTKTSMESRYSKLMEQRMGLVVHEAKDVSVVASYYKLSLLMMRQLEEGLQCEWMQTLWNEVLEGAPWCSPMALSPLRCQVAVEQIENSNPNWKATLLQKGAMLKGKDAKVYAGKEQYRKLESVHREDLDVLLTCSDPIKRLSSILTEGGSAAWCVAQWLMIFIEVVRDRVDGDSWAANEQHKAQLGLTWGPWDLVDQLPYESLLPYLSSGEKEEWKALKKNSHFEVKEGAVHFKKGRLKSRLALDGLSPSTFRFHPNVLEGKTWSLKQDGDGVLFFILEEERLTASTLEGIQRALEASLSKEQPLVISHLGKHFCAGEDWQAMLDASEAKNFKAIDVFMTSSQMLLMAIRGHEQPVGFCVEGLSLGGATSLLNQGHLCLLGAHFGSGYDTAPIGCPPSMGITSSWLRDLSIKDSELSWVTGLRHRVEQMLSGGILWGGARFEAAPWARCWTVPNRERRWSSASRTLRDMLEDGWSPVQSEPQFFSCGASVCSSLDQQVIMMSEMGRMDRVQRDLALGLHRVCTGGGLPKGQALPERHLWELERELVLTQLGKVEVRARLKQALSQGMAHG